MIWERFAETHAAREADLQIDTTEMTTAEAAELIGQTIDAAEA